MTVISFMTANFVARQLGYNMTEGWMQGDNATNEYFRPIETYAERFEEVLKEITAMGFSTLDIWNGHLNWAWATDEHIAIAKELLAKHGLTVASTAGWFGGTPEEFAKACKVAAAVGAPVLGGNTGLIGTDRASLVSILKEHGVKFGYENHPEKTPQEILEKIDYGRNSDGTVGIAVDTGWFGTQSYDSAKAIEELGEHLIHVHLKDVVAAGGHETCRFGTGVVGIEGCVRALQRIGYTGAITVEHEPDHYDPTEDVRASYEMLKGWLGQ